MKKDHLTRELPLLASLAKPVTVDAVQLASFGDDEKSAVTAAVVWAWRNRRVQSMSQRHAAELCDIKPQHFSLIVAGRRLYLPPHKINVFTDVVGNTAVMQTIARFAEIREQRAREQLGSLVADRLSA